MLDELIKEIEKKRAEESETIKQNMIDEMKKCTLRENVERILGSLAELGLEKSLLNMLPNPDRTEIQKAQEVGVISTLATVCESLKAALDNSLPN